MNRYTRARLVFYIVGLASFNLALLLTARAIGEPDRFAFTGWWLGAAALWASFAISTYCAVAEYP